MLIGVLLSLVGGLVLFARLLAGDSASTDSVNVWSGASVLAGIGILCFRYGVILDGRRRTSAKWWGLLVPLYRFGERPLSSACYVSISSRRMRNPPKNTLLERATEPLVSMRDHLSVALEEPGRDAIELRETQDYDDARRFAEEFAKFLNTPLRDRSSREEVVREAGKLDEPLRDRLRRTRQPVPLPAPIEGARAIFNYGGIGASTSIEMPPAGINTRSVLKALLGAFSLLLAGVVGIGKGRESMDASTLLFILMAVFLLGLVLAARSLTRAASYREHLVVSPDGIVIAQHSPSGTKTTRLASAEVEEIALIALHLPRSFHDSMSRVVIRSDRGSIELGATLSKAEEVRWLRDVLMHALTPVSPETKAV